ncbi:hypothetical protein [Streptomyces sp. NPDC054849]
MNTNSTMNTHNTMHTEGAMPHGSSLIDAPARHAGDAHPVGRRAVRAVGAIPRTDTGWTFIAT